RESKVKLKERADEREVAQRSKRLLLGPVGRRLERQKAQRAGSLPGWLKPPEGRVANPRRGGRECMDHSRAPHYARASNHDLAPAMPRPANQFGAVSRACALL